MDLAIEPTRSLKEIGYEPDGRLHKLSPRHYSQKGAIQNIDL